MDSLSESELKEAKHYHCSFNHGPTHEDLYGNKLLLIRHALSEFNYVYERLFIDDPNLSRTDPALDDVRVNLKYLDTPLHKIGEQQCISNQDHICKIDTELVLISPLQRTLQTAILLFQKHPNRKNIRFLICPWVSESLNASCCLSNQIYGEMRERYVKLAQKYDITLDFSILDDKKEFPSQLRWQVEQMEDGDQHRLLAKDIVDEKQYAQHVSDEMKRMYPTFYETWVQLIKRSETFKIKLKEILKQQSKTVTIVSHCNFLKCLTKVRVDEKGWVHGLHINNCGMSYYKIED